MLSFYQFETFDFTIRVKRKGEESSPGILEGFKEIVVSFEQNGMDLLNITDAELGIDVEESTIGVHLTQENTGAMNPGTVKVQVNVYFEDTERDVTGKGKVKVKDNLYKKVMS